MSAPKKTKRPSKPTPDFPLSPRANGQWGKKIRGKIVCFGPWSDPDAALSRYLDQREDLQAGRKPRQYSREGTSVRDLVNRFLTDKKILVDSDLMSPRSWADYKDSCDGIVSHFGLSRPVADIRPEDFSSFYKVLQKGRGPVTTGSLVGRARVVFNYATRADLVETPVKFGPLFVKPSRAIMRKHRKAKGPRVWTADEIKTLLSEATPQLRAMILLAINCGFGNRDCGLLPLDSIDLVGGGDFGPSINFPRPKTGIDRRAPLWPETVEALRVVLQTRPEPTDEADAGLLFITKYRNRWTKETKSDPLSQAFGKLCRSVGLGNKTGVGFYGLRHTFRTAAMRCRDSEAVDFIMGHAPDSNDMGAVYTEWVDDDRLLAATDAVRSWLFPSDEAVTIGPKLLSIA